MFFLHFADLVLALSVAQPKIQSCRCTSQKAIPHHGVEKINLVEAREMIADNMARAQKLAAQALAKAQADAKTIAAINDILFS